MEGECLFKFCYNCSDTERLQCSKGDDRLDSIMKASKTHNDHLDAVLQRKMENNPAYKGTYHKACVSKYLTKAKRLSDKMKHAGTSVSDPHPDKKTCLSLGHPFDCLTQCLYCGCCCNIVPDPKHPDRWVPAYLVRETEGKLKNVATNQKTDAIEKRIMDKCHERGDEWGDNVMRCLACLKVRAADLHAADARYHRDCYTRFFNGRSPPGDFKGVTLAEPPQTALESLVKEMQDHRSQMWDSVQLMKSYEEFGGKPMRRSVLISSICELIEDLVVLSARGYRSVVFFRDNTIATMKMVRDDDEDDNLEAALNVVAKHIKKECLEMDFDHHTYQTKISRDTAEESTSDTLQQLLGKLSLDEHSLPSILIGNIISSTITKHPTPLQVALAVYFHKKKIVKHMYDYRVCCSYDELLRFKRSSAVAKYNQICSAHQHPVRVEGLVQVIVDNFDANLSSPNGMVSTHDLATIETHSKPPLEVLSDTIPRINKADMTDPIDVEEEIVLYSGTEKPLPPYMPPHDLPDDYFEAQRIAYERANDLDFSFLKVKPALKNNSVLKETC